MVHGSASNQWDTEDGVSVIWEENTVDQLSL